MCIAKDVLPDPSYGTPLIRNKIPVEGFLIFSLFIIFIVRGFPDYEYKNSN